MFGLDNSKSIARQRFVVSTGSVWKSRASQAAIAGALAMLSACATQQQDVQPPKGAPFVEHFDNTTPALLNLNHGAPPSPDNNGNPSSAPTSQSETDHQIVRYIGTSSNDWPWNPAVLDYSDLYTRVELFADNDQTGVGASENTHALRDYASENRSWLLRLLSSETDTVTTLANIDVRDPQLSITVPLFSISHASGAGLGNTWTTNFTSSDVGSPLFRLGPNTGLTVHLNTKVSSDLKSQGASLVVGAVQKAVQIAAPQSTLLTTLSAPDIANTASAIDTAISGLFSRDISEDIQLGRLTDSWTGGASFTLYGCAPFVRDEGMTAKTVDANGNPIAPANGNCAKSIDLDGGYNIPVGVWTVKLACPHVSAFSSRGICDGKYPKAPVTADGFAKTVKADRAQVLTAANDAQILQFNLSSQVSIQTFVQSQGWFTTFTAAKTTAKTKSGTTDKSSDDYVAFCAGAILGLETSGLNQFDSALTLRAMIHQIPALAALRDSFAAGKNGASCVKQFQDATGSSTTSL
jgi:hypothetical protein